MGMSFLGFGKRKELLKKADELLEECCAHFGIKNKSLSQSGKDWVARRKWDEDLGDMRKIIYYAALTSNGNEIEAAHFPIRSIKDHEAFADKQFDSLSLEEVVRHKLTHFFKRLGNEEATNVHEAVVSRIERSLISLCLDWASGNQLKAARVLGINRNTLRKKIKELKIENKK